MQSNFEGRIFYNSYFVLNNSLVFLNLKHQNRKIRLVRDKMADKRMLEARCRNDKEKETTSILVSRGWVNEADNERTVFNFPRKVSVNTNNLYLS